MSKIISTFLLFFTLYSCREQKNNDIKQSETLPETTVTTPDRPYYKKLSEVVEEKEILKFWVAKESYYPTLHFNGKDTLELEFNGQCSYYFPFNAIDDSVVVYWDYIENCSHDIGIEKSFGLINKPLKGKPFMTLRLINDTTLQAAYHNKEWVNHFNSEYKDYKYLPETFLSTRH